MEATSQPGLSELTTETESTFISASETEVYQSVSRGAVASLILGVFGLASFPVAFLLVLPLLGLVFGFVALRSIRKFPDELQGKPLAITGVILCIATLVLAPTYHVIVYMTEVPEGYTRLNFAELTSPASAADVPPAEALQYNGQQVFIKGYIHPTSMDKMQSKKFVLVPDLGTCCFGSQPPLTHMIEVSLLGDQYARKNLRKQRLAGTLRINSSLKPVDGLNGVFYQLRADILK